MERQIEKLRGEGTQIWLATSSVDIIVMPLAEYFEVDGLIASSLEFHNGRSTGRFAGKPVFRPRKAESRARSGHFARSGPFLLFVFFGQHP